MSKYLYGAAVQGIQSFIFQTNKLQEIVGASELVEQICTDFFKNKVGKEKFKEKNLILGAAGNIKYIFDSREECEALVREFPKEVMEMAPGITISQAVVKLDEEKENAHQELEKRLRIQRNKPISITDGIGLMAMETARKTGGMGVAYRKEKESETVLDQAQVLKQKASESANNKLFKKIIKDPVSLHEKFPFNIEDIVSEDENKSWIAIIHADGNGLGQAIMDMTRNISQEQSFKVIKDFSGKLEKATVKACQTAFENVVGTPENKEKAKLPFRPIVLGGDDLTCIIRADLALDFTEVFLSEFENQTKEIFKDFGTKNQLSQNPLEKGLTACAGIAYIKASYPFHYGVSLAESLCGEAKKTSKQIDKGYAPSSLMCHKVRASFVEEFEDIVEKELTTKNKIHFDFGPYFVKPREGYATISKLKERIKNINRKSAPRAPLRNWLTELGQSEEAAAQTMQRIVDLNKNFRDRDLLVTPFVTRPVKENGEIKERRFTPIFDIINLSSIQKTNRKK